MNDSYTKEKTWPQYLIPCLFIALVIFIHQQNLQISFYLAGSLMLTLVFFSEKNRIVLWISIAFLFGHLFYMYANKFVDVADVSLPAKILLNRLLLICILIPISIIYYSFIKEKPIMLMYDRPVKIDKRVKLVLVLLFSLPVLIILVNKPITLQLLTYGLLFCFTHAALQELIWRGILLRAFTVQTTKKIAIFTSGIGFGITQSTVGFQFYSCILFCILGSFLAWLTIKTGNLVPSFLLFFYLSFLLVLTGVIFIGF